MRSGLRAKYRPRWQFQACHVDLIWFWWSQRHHYLQPPEWSGDHSRPVGEKYMSPYAHITGWGMCLPEKVLTNDDLAKIVDTNDAWIVERTGIRQRYIAGPHETTASLATEAALQALAEANL